MPSWSLVKHGESRSSVAPDRNCCFGLEHRGEMLDSWRVEPGRKLPPGRCNCSPYRNHFRRERRAECIRSGEPSQDGSRSSMHSMRSMH